MRQPQKRDVSHLDLKKYERQGVDISLIWSNFQRTPAERLQSNKNLLELIDHFQKKKLRGNPPL